MIPVWLVQYEYLGKPAHFITMDHIRAEAYAAQYAGIIFEYGPIAQCQKDNIKPSPPCSTTEEVVC